MAQKVLFLDRDGTLIREPSDFKIDSLEKLDFLPGVISSLKRLQDGGYHLVMVSNQDGLGTPDLPTEHFWGPQRMMERILASEGVHFAAVYVDEHYEHQQHHNRKPNTGMPEQYMAQHDVDLTQSFVVGDRKTDAMLAHNLGCRSLTMKDPQSNDGDVRCPHVPQTATLVFDRWQALADYLLLGNTTGIIRRHS